MDLSVWQVLVLVYGIICIYIGLFKPPFIWKMKKFEIMQKMFGGPLGLQIFVLVWGGAAIAIALLVNF
jgi:hypothetical protein